MLITIENVKTQKQTQIEVVDDFCDDADDLLISFGMERYKLVSTKSDADKKREALAVEFGETYYGELYSKFPDFGEDNCLLTKEACKDIIKAKLTGKFEELAKDSNIELLLTSLVTAFGNYCQVKKKMDARDAEIRNSRIHENVFFDYILRLEEVFRTAKTVKQITEGISKCHEYASVDERELFGYAIIFEQLKPFFDWCADMDRELKEIKPYKPITEQALYDDTDYFANHITPIATEVSNKLITLKDKYNVWINGEMQKNNADVFAEYLNNLDTAYKTLFDAYSMLREASTPQDSDKPDVVLLEHARENFQSKYKTFIRTMVDFRIEIELEPRHWATNNEKSFFLSHCAFVDYWYNLVVSQKDKNAGDKFMVQIGQHLNVLSKLKSGDVNCDKLLSGGYTDTELTEIMKPSTVN